MTLELHTPAARVDRAVSALPGRDTARYARLAERYGRTGVAPFIANPDVEVVDLLGGAGASGYAQGASLGGHPG